MNSTVSCPFEQTVLGDATRLRQYFTSLEEGHPHLTHLRELMSSADKKQIFIPCAASNRNGCARQAERIIIRIANGKPILGTSAVFVCGSDECLRLVMKRRRGEQKVFPFSFSGMLEFISEFSTDDAAKDFLKLLRKAHGLTSPGAPLYPSGIAGFFRDHTCEWTAQLEASLPSQGSTVEVEQ